jgi:HEAT repeat protein
MNRGCSYRSNVFAHDMHRILVRGCLSTLIVLALLLGGVAVSYRAAEAATEDGIESAIARVRELDEPVVLDDETLERWQIAMSGFVWFMPPDPSTVSAAAGYWHQYLGSQLEKVPEIVDLVELGATAAPAVNRALQDSIPADEEVRLLALVLGRIEDRDSVPVLVEVLQRAETMERDAERQLLDVAEGKRPPGPIKRVRPHTFEAIVWALQELAGHEHIFDAAGWRHWWSAHADTFVPVHQRGNRQVTRDEVEGVLRGAIAESGSRLTGDERLLQGEALAALGEGVLPFLIDPTVTWGRAQMAIRFALDELGSAHLLERSELQEYLVWRFHTDDAEQEIGDAARARAFTELPFDLFCRVALESDRYYYGESTMSSWISFDAPDLAETFGDGLESCIRLGLPVIEDGLYDPDAAVRAVAIALADKIGFETDLALPELVHALLDRRLVEEVPDLRQDVWVALSRFDTESVRAAVSSGLFSRDPRSIKGAAVAVRMRAALIDGDDEDSAVDRLVELLHNEDQTLRDAAAGALRGKHDKVLAESCEQILSEDASYWLREQCAIALSVAPPLRERGELLIKLASEPSWGIRQWALRALANREYCTFVPRLIEVSRQFSDDPTSRAGVLDTLVWIGGPEALSELIAELDREVTERKKNEALPSAVPPGYDPQLREKRTMKRLEKLTGRSFASAYEWLQWGLNAPAGEAPCAGVLLPNHQGR